MRAALAQEAVQDVHYSEHHGFGIVLGQNTEHQLAPDGHSIRPELVSGLA